jgi:hypothetical protein
MRTSTSETLRLIILFAALIVAAPDCRGDSQAGQEGSGRGTSPAAYPIRFYQRYISDLRYGHCRFEPSCSQYALEAVNEFGFFKGSALAADRLVRCNGRKNGYARSQRGRLLDSPVGNELPCRTPRVPEWLLPAAGDSIPPVDQAIAIAADVDSQDVLGRIFRWDASFAHALAAKGECARAETEYERLAFYANSQPMRRWAAMMAGWCYFRASEWNEAASRFSEAQRESRMPAERIEAGFMAASARFNAGDYEEGERVAAYSDSGAASATEATRAEILGALCSMARGSWTQGADRFARIADESSAPLDRRRALFLAESSRRGLDLPGKSPTAAVVMSTILPGAGQCYAGRPYDGFRHFLFDGLLIFSVVQLIRDEQYAAGYLLAGFTLPFYAGNIMGAKRSVDRFNACTRLEYVTESAEASGAR